MLKKSKFALAVAAVAALSTLTGCIGDTSKMTHSSDTFVMLKKYYNWNKSASSNRWINEVLFVIPGCICYPVLGGLVDALVCNSIQFWTGSNPLASDTTTFTEGGVEYRVAKTETTLTITNTATNEVSVFSLSEDGKTLAFSANGSTSTVAELVAEGRAVVYTADGAQEVSF